MDLRIIIFVLLIVVLGLVYLLWDEKKVNRTILETKEDLIGKLLETNKDLMDKVYFIRKDEYLAKKSLETPLEDMPPAPKGEEVGIPLAEADPEDIMAAMANSKK